MLFRSISVLKSLSKLITGGDKVSGSHVNQIVREFPHITIIQAYGPTENTTFSTTHTISKEYDQIPIGKPINNSSVYVFNEANKLQPVGVIGEICLGGDGLAQGYLNNVELTEEKFIDHPFNKGEKLYKSGDLGKWLDDGTLLFVGRVDDQVKIRGHRIELNEIELVLKRKESIDDAILLTRKDQSGDKELIAYMVSEQEQNSSDLRNYLAFQYTID